MIRDWASHTLAAAGLLACLLTGSVAAQPVTVPLTQWDGAFTDAQAARGRTVYGQHCAACHGDDLNGLPQAVYFPGASPRTPALAGDAFLGNWDGSTLADLLERTRISMPPANPGNLPASAIADILAFLLQASGYPQGARELPADRVGLSRITIQLHR